MYIGYIDLNKNKEVVEFQRQSLLSYAESNNFSIDLFYDKPLYNLKKDIVSDQKTIVFTNAYCLGHSFEKIQQNIEDLYKANFETIFVQENMCLPATANTEQVIAGIRKTVQINDRTKRSKNKLENADEQIRQMLDEGFPRSAIAEHFGVTRATLFKKLHQMGVETNRESIKVHFDDQKFIDLYQSGMSLIRMAKYFNCHVLTISKHVKDLGLEREQIIRAKPVNTTLSQLENSKKQIKQLYDAGWSYKKIANELNCDDTYICKLVKRWGWSKRQVLIKTYALDDHKSEIIELVQQGSSIDQIALKYGVVHSTVVSSLKRWGIGLK